MPSMQEAPRGEQSQPTYNLVEVDESIHGLLLRRQVGQGVVIEGFGRIVFTDSDQISLALNVGPISKTQIEMPQKRLELLWGSTYQFEGTDTFIVAYENSTISGPHAKIVLKCPQAVSVLRDELYYDPRGLNSSPR